MGRLQLDCGRFLSTHFLRDLYYHDPKRHAEEMRKLYNSMSKKPDWITLEDIDDYEKLMLNITEYGRTKTDTSKGNS